jgi:hypothetical protein
MSRCLWAQFPRNERPSHLTRDVVEVFEGAADQIDSEKEESRIEPGGRGLSSNEVLALIAPGLERLGFTVERGKVKEDRIDVPVLYGLNGRVEKAFQADAWHKEQRVVLEVEAGRGVVNNQFLKDLFQACMMDDVDGLIIAVRKVYQRNRDFDTVHRFIDTLYASGRLALPLKRIAIIGY